MLSVVGEHTGIPIYIYIYFPIIPQGNIGPRKVSPSDTVSGEYFDFFPCFALMSNLFEDCYASCCLGSSSLGVPF